jgi:DNA recombination protein RmuC
MLSPTLVILTAIAMLVVAVATIFAVVLAMRASRDGDRAARALESVTSQLDRVANGLGARMDGASGEMNRTLSHGLRTATETLATRIGTAREDTRARIDEKFLAVTERLGDLKATTERIAEFSRSLDEFQRMLQSPKLRGDFGEFTLDQMLSELVPADCYELQAPIAGARVDALLKTPNGALPIDSKFPLDNFRRALDATDDAGREAALKAFANDVRARIDEIADKYIRPPATLEIALMFVPAENVYYEVLSRPAIVEYGRSRRVVAVSPNTMYAYLQALAMGFRGMKIQQEARRVEEMLTDLTTHFDQFMEHFGKVGRHLDSAQLQFAGAVRTADRFQAILNDLRVGRLDAALEEPVEPLLKLAASKASDPL